MPSMVTTLSRICAAISSIFLSFNIPRGVVISRPMKMLRVMVMEGTSAESWKIVSTPRFSVSWRLGEFSFSPRHR